MSPHPSLTINPVFSMSSSRVDSNLGFVASTKEFQNAFPARNGEYSWAKEVNNDYNLYAKKDVGSLGLLDPSGGLTEGDWANNAAIYEWNDGYGDVGPEFPELEVQRSGCGIHRPTSFSGNVKHVTFAIPTPMDSVQQKKLRCLERENDRLMMRNYIKEVTEDRNVPVTVLPTHETHKDLLQRLVSADAFHTRWDQHSLVNALLVDPDHQRQPTPFLHTSAYNQFTSGEFDEAVSSKALIQFAMAEDLAPGFFKAMVEERELLMRARLRTMTETVTEFGDELVKERLLLEKLNSGAVADLPYLIDIEKVREKAVAFQATIKVAQDQISRLTNLVHAQSSALNMIDIQKVYEKSAADKATIKAAQDQILSLEGLLQARDDACKVEQKSLWKRLGSPVTSSKTEKIVAQKVVEKEMVEEECETLLNAGSSGPSSICSEDRSEVLEAEKVIDGSFSNFEEDTRRFTSSGNLGGWEML